MIKVGHLYWTQNGNWGDIVVGNITKRLFSYFIEGCIYLDINILLSDDKDKWNKYCKEINKNDLLLIGGGGILAWIGYFIKYTDFLEKIKIPIIIYGVGLNSFRHEDGTNDRLMFDNDWLKILKEKCLFLSVRNDGTKNEISGYNKIDFNESPEQCLWTNLFYTFNPEDLDKRLYNQKYILLCLANDYTKSRFDNNNSNYEYFSGEIYKITNILKKLGYKIQIINHRINDESYNLKSEIEWYTFDTINNKEIKSGLILYQFANTVISMRGHGQIISCSYNTPVISIINQTKNSGFAKSLQIDDYSIDIIEKDIKDMIIWGIEDINRNKLDIQTKILNNRINLWQHTINDFKKIKEKLSVSLST